MIGVGVAISGGGGSGARVVVPSASPLRRLLKGGLSGGGGWRQPEEFSVAIRPASALAIHGGGTQPRRPQMCAECGHCSFA